MAIAASSQTAVSGTTKPPRKRKYTKMQRREHRAAYLFILPWIIGFLIFQLGAMIYSLVLSFTNSKLFPTFNFVGTYQYDRLWATPRWVESVKHIWFYGAAQIIISLVLGFLLALFMDQRVRGEDTFRTIFLYPFALSAVITGLVWQFMMDPIWGLQAAMRSFAALKTASFFARRSSRGVGVVPISLAR